MDVCGKSKVGYILFMAMALVIISNLVFPDQKLHPVEKHFSKNEIDSDIRYLMNLIQDVHPDPYSGIGGRVAFQLEVQRILKSTPHEGMTGQELYALLRPFFGEMGDGHSNITNPTSYKSSTETLYLPIKFRVANDSIFISEAHKSYQELIGCRLNAVNGKSMADLVEATKNLYPAENKFAASRWLIRLLISSRSIRHLFPDMNEKLILSLLDISGSRIKRSVPFSLSREDRQKEIWTSTRWDEITAKPLPFHHHIWVDKDAAYLKIKTVMAREAFEIMKANKRTDLDQRLESFYKNTLKKPKPKNITQAIEGIPSLTEHVSQLLYKMKQLQVKHMIIDIRGNDGGWSAIAYPMFYMLFGDRFFAQEPVYFATRISKQHLQLFNMDLKSLNDRDNSSYRLGDLRVQVSSNKKTADELRKQFISELRVDNLHFLSHIEGLNGNPLYTPDVYVLTDPGTFSAAYDMMFHLWRNGAKIVGIPPAQSANTYVDPSPFELPNTKIAGNISRTAVIYPGIVEIERAFRLDFPMNWTEFRRYDFDLHSEVLYVLDLIQNRI